MADNLALIDELVRSELQRRDLEQRCIVLRQQLGLLPGGTPRRGRPPNKARSLAPAAQEAITQATEKPAKSHTMSAAGRAAISKATKARWAKKKRQATQLGTAALNLGEVKLRKPVEWTPAMRRAAAERMRRTNASRYGTKSKAVNA